MSRTGHPREFYRDEAHDRAMKLFWAQGYEGTTLSDLQKAMGGITAPSFYAAFGSKEGCSARWSNSTRRQKARPS